MTTTKIHTGTLSFSIRDHVAHRTVWYGGDRGNRSVFHHYRCMNVDNDRYTKRLYCTDDAGVRRVVRDGDEFYA